MREMVVGAVAMGCFIVSLFFLRFWKKTGDRFFLFFAAAFFIQSVDRAFMGIYKASEDIPAFFLVRLVAFGFILMAIIDKNRSKKTSL